VKTVSGVDFPVIEAPRRPGDPAMLVARAGRVRELLGWSPGYNNSPPSSPDAWRWESALARQIQKFNVQGPRLDSICLETLNIEP